MTIRTFNLLLLGILFGVNILFLAFGYDTTLHKIWNIPTMHPCFADIRTITGVNKTLSQGLDPLITNPGDPWHRTMNYPRIWQYIAVFFNLDQNFGIYFGIINIFLYIIGFLLFSSRLLLSKKMAMLLIITFLSPASILAMERGNIDIIMFFLISISIYYILIPILFTFFILLAAILKIFPIFGVVGLLRCPKKIFFLYFAPIVLIFITYFIINIDDIILIKQGTPQAIALSYGMNIPWMATQKLLGGIAGTIVKYTTYSYLSALIIFIYIKVKKNINTLSLIDTTYIDAFRIGSAIYIGTFLLSNNWDYRLIFLIFTIPQLIFWAKSEIKAIRLIAIVSIFCTLFTMWYLDLYRIIGKVAWAGDELSNWVLFSLLLFLFVVTLPTWLLEFIAIKKKND